jgi:hypothetical protein
LLDTSFDPECRELGIGRLAANRLKPGRKRSLSIRF